jgi:two-component system response regulator QseB
MTSEFLQVHVIEMKSAMRLLLVEDDEKTARWLARELTRRRLCVTTIGDGLDALARLRKRTVDVCLLDLQLPGLHGFRVLERARAEGITTPIIIVTGRDAVPERVRALDLGADDYVVKPFATDELVARIRAVVRRGSGQTDHQLRHDSIVLDPSSRTVTVRGKPVPLPKKEFALLELLLRRRGAVVRREAMIECIWGDGKTVADNVLDVHMANLRRLIAMNEQKSPIQTVRGVGYRMGGDDE